jgi:hypothetical protein
MNKIFIQIASYRDPELKPTIRNCLDTAKHPENLTFGICWQHDDTEDLNEYMNDPRFKIISINFRETRGCCWARHKVQQLYSDEKYTLQLDSHHRFTKHWDAILIKMYKDLRKNGIPKPLITAYLPSYEPSNDPAARSLAPWKMEFKEKTSDKQVIFIPSVIEDFEALKAPLIARFYSAHFAFASGKFVKEVPHDPDLYFIGEEMSITVRAFTKGYDLFHPHTLIAWHEYTRQNKPKHWDDDSVWWKKDVSSKQHYMSVFTNYGPYGIGKKRSVAQYISFSGMDFLNFEAVLPQKIRVLDEPWKLWIVENVGRGVPRHMITKVLLDALFDPAEADVELDKAFHLHLSGSNNSL